jgi:membrane protease YdiL (CAAX protease family)
MSATDAVQASPAATPRWRRLVCNHPLGSFFAMACGLSWLAWIPYISSSNGLGLWHYHFPVILGTGQIAGVLPGLYAGPIAAAALVTAVAEGRAGLRTWVGRLRRWRVAPRWYALALLGVPAVMLVTGAVFAGGQVRAPSTLAALAYLPGLVLQMATTGIGEEPGWRDFALPRLQHRMGALRAVFVLGTVWGIWHLPLFLTDWGGWPDAHWSRPLVFVVFCIAFSVVLSWVFNRTGESLPVVMLMHVSVNDVASILWADMFPTLDTERVMAATTVVAALAAVVVLVGTRGRLGYRPDPGTGHPRDYRNRLAP